MAQMIRKQLYITRAQQALLNRLSKLRRLSQSEIIRQAIEREATSGVTWAGIADETALDEIIAYALGRQALGVQGRAYQWQREDSYAERLERFGADQVSAS